MEQYSKGKRQFSSSYTKLTASPKPFVPLKLEVTPKEAGSKDKAKTFIWEFPKQLDGKRCFKCQVMGISKLIVQTGGS